MLPCKIPNWAHDEHTSMEIKLFSSWRPHQTPLDSFQPASPSSNLHDPNHPPNNGVKDEVPLNDFLSLNRQELKLVSSTSSPSGAAEQSLENMLAGMEGQHQPLAIASLPFRRGCTHCPSVGGFMHPHNPPCVQPLAVGYGVKPLISYTANTSSQFKHIADLSSGNPVTLTRTHTSHRVTSTPKCFLKYKHDSLIQDVKGSG